MKEKVEALHTRFTELKKMEAEFKMALGKFDDDSKAVLKEIGLAPEANLNIIEILHAALK